jgi:hypothetical protein
MDIDIFEEDGDHTLSFETEFSNHDVDVYPDTKTFTSRMNLKEDLYYRTEKFEYRIKIDPLLLETRLIERVDEPPQRYCVKDGVVLESEIRANQKFGVDEFIAGLKEEVEWHDEWSGSLISMYILSLHPETISKDDYRRYLRQLSEKIKTGLIKVEKALESDPIGLQVTDEYSSSGRTIWFPRKKQDEMSEEEIEKAIEYSEGVKKRLLEKESTEYVGINEGEFRTSPDILKHIDVFLNKKDKSSAPPLSIRSSVGKLFGFILGWCINFLIVSFLLWLLSLIVPAIQYSSVFAFFISGGLTIFYTVRKKKSHNNTYESTPLSPYVFLQSTLVQYCKRCPRHS